MRVVSHAREPKKKTEVVLLLVDQIWFLQRQCLFHHIRSLSFAVTFNALEPEFGFTFECHSLNSPTFF